MLTVLDQVEAHFNAREPQVLAFMPEDGRFDRLRREARQLLDRYPQPDRRPPLFGVLVGVKDIFRVDGFPTRAGSRLPPDLFAGEEAESVTRLKQAGTLILGKTVSTEFAYFAPGQTRNPRNLQHTPGGSSSGSAATVAAGLCPVALGTQTIGSIIRPAAFCGAVGYKPSYERISRAGVIPLSPSLDHVGLFAGYYAALDQGFYKDENLDVTILEGGPNIAPEQVVASGGAQFGIDWMGSLLSSRDQGVDLVNIAQPFQRGAILEISWKDSNINGVPDLKGKTVGVWGFGNEFDLLAALNKHGVDKDKDLTLFQQPFDMNDLLNKKIDAAAAMTYNEYAQVLEAGHSPSELNVINFTQEGTAMLEDGVFTTADWLKDPKNQDIAVRFLRASFKGWIYCRDNPDACVDIVVKHGPALGKNHQQWMMNEINKLIWPSSNGTGIMDDAAWQRTADTALKFGVIKNAASKDAYTTEYAKKALAGITGDTTGTSWKPIEVKLDGAKP